MKSILNIALSNFKSHAPHHRLSDRSHAILDGCWRPAPAEEPRSADPDPPISSSLPPATSGSADRAARKDAGGLSATTVSRLKDAWSEEHARWSKRDLLAKRYVYFWVDGIHVQARLEVAAQCLLIIIGATPEGKKELVA